MDDLNPYALRLLKFVEDSVEEALNDQSSQQALLREADDAVRVLQRTLKREDQLRLAQLMLLGVFDDALEIIANECPDDPSAKLKAALQRKLTARALFSEPSLSPGGAP
jgi:hypothetical protein